MWIGRRYNWVENYPILEESHYLRCSECGYNHPIYTYSVWTNTLRLATVYSEKVEIPNYCARCGAKNYNDNCSKE